MREPRNDNEAADCPTGKSPLSDFRQFDASVRFGKPQNRVRAQVNFASGFKPIRWFSPATPKISFPFFRNI